MFIRLSLKVLEFLCVCVCVCVWGSNTASDKGYVIN